MNFPFLCNEYGIDNEIFKGLLFYLTEGGDMNQMFLKKRKSYLQTSNVLSTPSSFIWPACNICVADEHKNEPPVKTKISCSCFLFCHFPLYKRILLNIWKTLSTTSKWPVKQKLLTILELLSSSLVFFGVAQSLVFCILLCRLLSFCSFCCHGVFLFLICDNHLISSVHFYINSPILGY